MMPFVENPKTVDAAGAKADEADSAALADPPVLPMTRVYSGKREADGTTRVSVDNRPLNPARLGSGTVTAFDWGYDGRGGPAQLALAMLADHFGDHEKARRLYQEFTRLVIRELPREGWILTAGEIDRSCPEDRP
jgi:hypothetical protein